MELRKLKVSYADDVDSMCAELRGQACKLARVHVVTSLNGQTLVLKLYFTAFWNNLLYESITTYSYAAGGLQAEQLATLVQEKSNELRADFIEKKCRGIEIKKGIYQEG